MARAATSPELTLYRTPGIWSRLRCAVLTPPIVYRARVNQTFSSFDTVRSVIFDGGSGTLADVLPDMEVWVGSSLDAHDKGICRLRDKDATHFYLSETSEISFADNDYITILAGFGVWARPVRIVDGDALMDEVEYSDQHTNWDPQPNMGVHQVLELTGASVTTSFDASTSFCPGSSIEEYAWTCATASAASDLDTDAPTFEFDTVGWHLVYLTITAENGKQFFGVRYVYVWDKENPPPAAEITNAGRCAVDAGGWEIELTLYGGAGLDDIYERAMVILFSEDHYGDTVAAIGPVEGSENIKFVGWISREKHLISAEQGSVTFSAHGAAYWMGKIPSWPDGVQLSSGTPAAWTSVQALTVDLGVYHFLRHRSTVTRIMDITLSGDTRISDQVSSSSQNLWGQLQEMNWNQIYARPGVNALNQLSIQIHPCLIPTEDRDYPTVMAITKQDWRDGIDFDRAILPEVGIVDMSGIKVNGPGLGEAFFALAPGHSLPHYGDWDIQPNLLLASQEQVIILAGLYRSWKNNPLNDIPLNFLAPIGLIDCFPNQRCTIDIAAGDNIRGIAYNGGLIPTSVALIQDPETGYLHTEATFEAETFESQAIIGDTPGSGDPSRPPVPSLPPPFFPPIILPGLPTPTPLGPTRVLFHDQGVGMILAESFDTDPVYSLVNAGLTMGQRQAVNWFCVCPNGSFYVAYIASSGGGDFIARAPTVGGVFEVISEHTNSDAEDPMMHWSVGYNPLLPESIGFVRGPGAAKKLWVGSYAGGYDEGVGIPGGFGLANDGLTYGLGKWLLTYFNAYSTYSTDGSTLLGSGTENISPFHRRAATTGRTLHTRNFPAGIIKAENNFASSAIMSTESVAGNSIVIDSSGQYMMANVVSTGGKAKSSDFGASFSPLPSLPPGNWCYGYAGVGTTPGSPRFIAAGAVVRYTPDFGTTWENKENTSLTGLTPFPDIDLVKVLEY